MEQNRNQSLAHFGVLGMKWGVRRNNRHIGVTPSRQKAFDERDAKRAKVKSARQEYIKTEKSAREKYERLSPVRIKTGKEFADTFGGVIAGVGILTSAAYITKQVTGTNYVSKFFDFMGD